MGKHSAVLTDRQVARQLEANINTSSFSLPSPLPTRMVMPFLDCPLPAEILTEILKFVHPLDQGAFSLSSQLLRKYTLPFIFGHLQYTGNIIPKIRNIHQARKDVKGSVRKLELKAKWVNNKEGNDSNILFHFLATLPNLHTFSYGQKGDLVRMADLPLLINSVQHAPLRNFTLNTGYVDEVEGTPKLGLASLESLSIINWNFVQYSTPESSLAYLYELIRPSLSTLVELKIKSSLELPCLDVDIQFLRPAGDTLRSFECTFPSGNESVLDIIPDIFPNLTKLAITWSNFSSHSLPWKGAHIKSLSRNKNLEDLMLSSDFEMVSKDTWTEEFDDNYTAWYIRCYERRLKATQDIAPACPRLRRCTWVQLGVDSLDLFIEHPFVIQEQISGSEREMVKRVVRGVKQNWMGRDYMDGSTGDIVV